MQLPLHGGLTLVATRDQTNGITNYIRPILVRRSFFESRRRSFLSRLLLSLATSQTIDARTSGRPSEANNLVSMGSSIDLVPAPYHRVPLTKAAAPLPVQSYRIVVEAPKEAMNDNASANTSLVTV
jgi:hypothetical protein